MAEFRAISSASNEYLPVVIQLKAGGTYQNVSADTVAMAFLPHSNTDTPTQPSSGDFHVATWDTDSTGSRAIYTALCLVGPSGVQLAAGEYDVWVKITDNPEVPVLLAGTLTIT